MKNRCPACGGGVIIHGVLTDVEVDDTGATAGDLEWTDDNLVSCRSCGWTGTVGLLIEGDET